MKQCFCCFQILKTLLSKDIKYVQTELFSAKLPNFIHVFKSYNKKMK